MHFSKIALKKNDNTEIEINVDGETPVNSADFQPILNNIQQFVNNNNTKESQGIASSFFLFELDENTTKPVIVSVLKKEEGNGPQTFIVDTRIDGKQFSGNLSEFVQNKMNINFNEQTWQSRILDISDTISTENINKLIIESNNKFLGDSNKINSESIAKGLSLKQKIEELESKVEEYKGQRSEKEKLEEQIDNLLSKENEIKSKLSSSGELVTNLDRIDSELKKFGILVQDNSLEMKTEAIKQNRIAQVITTLKNIPNKMRSLVAYEQVEKPSNPENFTSILVVLFFQVLFSLGAYALTTDLRIIYFGIAALGLILLFMIYLKINASKTWAIEQPVSEDPGFEIKVNFDNLINRLERSEEEFLVNAAWVEALKEERKKTVQSLNSNLNGEDYYKLKASLDGIRSETVECNRKIEEISSKKISAEEYLKLRRDLDLSKIELEELTESEKGGLEIVNVLAKVEVPLILYYTQLKEEIQKYLGEIRKLLVGKVQLIQIRVVN